MTSPSCRGLTLVAAFSLLIAFDILCLTQLAQAQSQKDESIIKSFIAQQAKRARATEYEEARSIVHGKLNGDSDKDAVALYTLEGFGGSNRYEQYLAVFISRKGRLQYLTQRVMGGKNQKQIDSISIKNGKINLQTKEYLPTDASCCPSKAGHATLILINGRLKEIELHTR